MRPLEKFKRDFIKLAVIIDIGDPKINSIEIRNSQHDSKACNLAYQIATTDSTNHKQVS
jgi:hypothetical protein